MKLRIIFISCVILITIYNGYSQNSRVVSAFNYHRNGKLDKAKANIDLAIEHPITMNSAKTWFYCGNIYIDIYRSTKPKYKNLDPLAINKAYAAYKKAIYYLEMLVEMEYPEPSIYSSLGRTYFEMYEDSEKGAYYYSKGRSNYPGNLNLLLNETNFFLADGQTDKAIENLKLTATMDQTNPTIFFAIGAKYNEIVDDISKKAKIREDAFQEAEEAYIKSISLKPDYFDPVYNLGALYVNLAAYIIDKANQLPLDQQEEYDNELNKANKLLRLAMGFLEYSLKLEPNFERTHASLKEIYKRLHLNDKLNLLSTGNSYSIANAANFPQLNINKNYHKDIYKNPDVIKNFDEDKFIPPIITVYNISFVDDNGDNIITAGETGKISFEIRNDGKGLAKDLRLKISLKTDTKGLSFIGEKKVGNIQSKYSKEIQLLINSDLSLANGIASLEIEFFEKNGFHPDPIIISINTERYPKPEFIFSEFRFSSKDEPITTTSPITLQLILQNVGKGKSEDVKVSFKYPENVYPLTESNIFIKILM